VSRIFLILASLANAGLVVAFVLGWRIGDAGSLDEAARQQVSSHFLFSLAAVMLALLVHAIVLTYFMGTGRWIEETTEAYRFSPAARDENIKLKYRVIPGMVACLGLLIVTGAFGAIADPASNSQMPSAATIHFLLAVASVFANILISVW
jgi:hypothetical protein